MASLIVLSTATGCGGDSTDKSNGAGPTALSPSETNVTIDEERAREALKRMPTAKTGNVPRKVAFQIKKGITKQQLRNELGPATTVTREGTKVKVECWVYLLDDSSEVKYCFEGDRVAAWSAE